MDQTKKMIHRSAQLPKAIFNVMAKDYLFCHKAFTHVEDNDVLSFVLSSLWLCIHSIGNKERRKT